MVKVEKFIQGSIEKIRNDVKAGNHRALSGVDSSVCAVLGAQGYRRFCHADLHRYRSHAKR